MDSLIILLSTNFNRYLTKLVLHQMKLEVNLLSNLDIYGI